MFNETNGQQAFITSMGTFLPGPPISNSEMEDYLGLFNGKPSRLKNRILNANGIKSRHYALDRNQKSTYQNSEMAAHAVRACLDRSDLSDRQLQMLAVATTQGDLNLPGMASIVQSTLDLPPMEILTTHGVCSSSLMALKSAVNNVRLGEADNAVVCASELASRLLKKSRYEMTSEPVTFESEFLRWMLSDGASACLIQSRPAPQSLSLRVDWVKIISFASDFDLCMSCGTAEQKQWTRKATNKQSDLIDKMRSVSNNGKLGLLEKPSVETDLLLPDAVSWQDYPSYAEAEAAGALLIRQNLRVLESIVKVGVEGFLRLTQQGLITASEIDHLVCHYSSHHFQEEILKTMQLLGCYVPLERWFTNLYEKGNTGSAAMFIALEELFNSRRLKSGETVMCVVPESGRFCTAYMKLTVVET